jgi:hypothetical protein
MVDMEPVRAHPNGFFRSRWGWTVLIVVILLLVLLAMYLWSICSSCIGVDRPSSMMLGECRRQLDAYAYEIPGYTAHERYLIDTPPRSAIGKNEIKFYVAIMKRQIADEYTSVAPESVAIEVHRPNDIDHLYNTPVRTCHWTKGTPWQKRPARGSADTNPVYGVTCDLTNAQYDSQEWETGIVKYRVLIKNWSAVDLNYCFVSTCDARYPAGKGCDIQSPLPTESQISEVSQD